MKSYRKDIYQLDNQLIYSYFFTNHSYFFYSTVRPLDFSNYLILSSLRDNPWTYSFMLKLIETNSIFFGEGVVVSMVLTSAFRAKPNPSSWVKFYLYYCFKKEFAATWLLPMAVAFHPA